MAAVEAILNGDVRALARAITGLENEDTEAAKTLRSLYKYAGRAVVVGITGVPGSGKSTMINQMIGVYLARNYKVAVLAVDPTSPFSGGGLLGDRVRMPRLSPKLFIRSLATRGQLGGLIRAAGSIITLLDAAGYDRIIIETVGTGQAEVEIKEYAQTVVVVSVPNLGDGIQALKTGILEIGHLYVVNKADLDGADRLESELREMLAIRGNNSGWQPPVMPVVAQAGRGICELVDAAEQHYEHLKRTGLLPVQRLNLAKNELASRLQRELWETALQRLTATGSWQDCCARIAEGSLDSLSAVERLARELHSSHLREAEDSLSAEISEGVPR